MTDVAHQIGSRVGEVVVSDPALEQPDFEVQLESLSQFQLAWRRFRKHRLAMFGAFLFLGMCAVAIVGPIFLPYSFYTVPPYDPSCADPSAGCPPSLAHPFGETGNLQRDVFTMVINGARLSLLIGVGASAFGATIGAIVGGIAGYFGGWVDNLLMRIVDIMLSLPLLFVILVVSKFLGNGNWYMIMFIFAIFGWPGISRLVRSLFLTLREEDYVDAARAAGVGDFRIIFRHILPNAMSPIIVAATLSVALVIISEAFVSFLGFGVDITQPTWGNILSNSLNFITRGNWWWPLFPGLAIVITVLGINFMGDGLRDALDPKARE
jgi:peptide/nickel transport system permease protein